MRHQGRSNVKGNLNVSGLSNLTTLTELNVRGNSFGITGTPGITRLDVTGLTSLTTLNLSDNNFASVTSLNATDLAARTDSSLLNLYNLPLLRYLTLTNSGISAAVISGFPALTTLDLSANAISGHVDSTGVGTNVRNSLGNLPALTTLDLSYNAFAITDVIALDTGLPALKRVVAQNIRNAYPCTGIRVPSTTVVVATCL